MVQCLALLCDEVARGGSDRTFSNYISSGDRESKVARLLSHKFGVVRLDRTFSNYSSSGDTRCAGCYVH